MPTTVLVTWATRYGSTEEVAHAIADDLLQQGLIVNTVPMAAVANLDRYDAVVLGFALYMGRMHRDARRFLSDYRGALVRHPVAVFVLGPIHATAKEFSASEKQLAKELARFPWFSPVDQQLIGGRFDPATLGFPMNFLPVLRKVAASDARNWDAIHAWADTLPSVFQIAMVR